MSFSRQQLKAAAEQALREGDEPMAREIAARMLRMEDAENKEIFGEQRTDIQLPMIGRVELPKEISEFTIGMGKGMTDVGWGAKDLALRAINEEGDQDDALARLNKRADEDNRVYQEGLGDSIPAFMGQLTGEVATTAPLITTPIAWAGRGLQSAAAIRAAQAAKHAGTTLDTTGKAVASGRMAMAEGAITEGLINRGGAEDRLQAAAIGGAMGKAADFGMQKLGARAGADRIAEDKLGYRDRLAKHNEDADELQRLAKEEGGIDLDRVDATGQGYMERDFLVGDPTYDAQRALVQKQMQDKAGSFISDEAREMSGRTMREDVATSFQNAIGNRRKYSEAEVDAYYEDLRRSHGDEVVPMDGLDGAADTFLRNRSDGGEVLLEDTAVGSKIGDIFAQYGIIAGSGKNLKGLNSQGLSRNPAKARGLKVKHLVDLRKELNALHNTAPGASGSGNMLVRQAKELVDEQVSMNFKNLTDESMETIGKGLKATEAFKQHKAVWGDKTFLGKLTKAGADSDSWAKDPQKALREVLSSDKAHELSKVKDALLTSKEGKAEWAKMGDLILLEALEAGTKRNPKELSAKAYADSFNRISPKAQTLLFGKKKAEQVEAAIRNWKLVGSTPTTKGDLNPSGTSASMRHKMIAVGARLGAAGGMFSGRASQVILAGPQALGLFDEAVAKKVREEDARLMLQGKLPAAAEQRIKDALKAEMAEIYGVPDMVNFENAANFLIRQALTKYVGSMGEDE